MNAFDRLKTLCDERGLSIGDLEEKLEFGKNSLYGWKKKIPNGANLEKVADYFNESVDYLLGRADRKESQKTYYALNEKDERDIAKRLESVMNSLDSESSLAFLGGEMDEETREMLMMALEHGMKIATETAKRKYTPKKYRK